MLLVGLAIRPIFGPDSDSHKNPPKNERINPWIPDSYFFDGFKDSSNILKGLFKIN